ncbi:hypothetical protein [Litorilituus lipolyticus]|uniref:Uncharacterized protein n=1 Tax=Litorilituus lipolyticus TaxID=2491017 RepID=A0A502KU47_9GAMM|nr:hypothetical protein [Litorilituus lipolyticus]TPH15260.1 hypothetical protein EPA86_10640 [Litorilituus lipolyticus]
MKLGIKLIAIMLMTLLVCSLQSTAYSMENANNSAEHNKWLKQRFSKQHEELIPVVAVADMFFSCNKARKSDPKNYEIAELVAMDRDLLAEKLTACLNGDTMQSEEALNFGLLGCFHEQLAHLPLEERQQKMKLVKQAISSLSRDERKRSFTQCVTEQSIHYLK